MSTEQAKNLPAGEEPSIGEVLDGVLELLKKVSNSKAQAILKMAGTQYNVRFVPAFAPIVPQQRTQLITRDTRGQKNLRAQPKADPEVKATRSQIKELNRKIAQQSRDDGNGDLREDHPLIVRRNHLFRALKNAQNKNPQAFKEAVEDEAQTAPEGLPAKLGLF
jgi:hypothetical protein